jgi:hypothetical protein
MGTSRSGEKHEAWVAGAFVYSGRPDPTWSISKRVAKKLHELWESLPESDERCEYRPGGLGYRGSFVRGSGHREWVAFNGLVSLTTPAGVEVRRDPARKFEKTLLSSAPKGLLPGGMLEGAWRAS